MGEGGANELKCTKPNQSLALGLFNTSIGTVGIQRLLSSMNKATPAPWSWLQKQMNSVGSAIQKLNVEDMAKQRRKLKDMFQHAGYAPDTPIPVECDWQYNLNVCYSWRRLPFAPATQTCNVLAENLTPEKKVIGFNYKNKLCKNGQFSRARGLNVNFLVIKAAQLHWSIATMLVMSSKVAGSWQSWWPRVGSQFALAK